MMYRDGDNITSPATVLCPSYEIMSSASEFWCEYSLDEQFCGTRLYLMLGNSIKIYFNSDFMILINTFKKWFKEIIVLFILCFVKLMKY